MSCTLVALAMCQAAQLGPGWQSYILLAAILIPFYSSQLLEHNIGLVRTQVGQLGVTEGQITQMLALIFCAVVGTDFLVNPLS